MTRSFHPGAEGAVAPTAKPPESAAQDPPTVLIVDDDPTARLTLAAVLSPDGYRIVFASDAVEVRQRLGRINPDVILCDLVMEEMSGDQFFRWLQAHERWRLVPIVGVTGFDNHVVRADLLHAGADSVLVKPCNAPELRAHVRAALRTRRKYAQLNDRYLRLVKLQATSAAS